MPAVGIGVPKNETCKQVHNWGLLSIGNFQTLGARFRSPYIMRIIVYWDLFWGRRFQESSHSVLIVPS